MYVLTAQRLRYPRARLCIAKIRLLLYVGWISIVVSGCGLAGEPRIVSTAVPTSLPAELIALFSQPADFELGAQVFSTNCTACHGERGLGDGPSVTSGAVPSIVNFTDPSTLNVTTPEEYFTVISSGRLDRFMPPWGSILSDTERWAVANYVYNLRRTQEVAAEGVTTQSANTDNTVAAEVSGTIAGSLVMGTAGSVLPDQVSVALQTLSLDFQEVGFQMTTASGGHYAFADVPMRADRMFVVTAVYQDHVFASPTISGDPAVVDVNAPITLYDATDDASVVEINLFVTRVEQQENNTVITQVVNFHNTSDRLFASYNSAKERDEAGHFPLPEQAVVLNESELMRCCVVEDGLLIDNEPLLPGDDHMFRVVYEVPLSAPLTVDFTFDFRVTNQLELMLTPGRYRVEGSQFTPQGTQQFSTGAYETYLADAPAIGGSFSVQMREIPATVQVNPSLAPILGFIGGGLIAAAAVLYLRLSRSVAARQERLLARITVLDTRYRTGEIGEVKYQTERARLKSRLAALMVPDESPRTD